MDEAEAQLFVAEEFFADADDQGLHCAGSKQPSWYPGHLPSYRPLLESLLIG